MYIVSVDLGNSQIKTPSTVPFTSGIINHGSEKPSFATDMLLYQDKYYSLSGTRLPYQQDKTDSEEWTALLLFAIARELQVQGVDTLMPHIALALGLPPQHFALREKAESFYRNLSPMTFYYNGKRLMLYIDRVFIYPQGLAAVAPIITNFTGNPLTYIVDIGGYTVDVLLLRHGRIDMTCCRSFNNGVIELINDIQSIGEAKYNTVLDEEHIRQALIHPNESYVPDPLKVEMTNRAQSYSQKIISKLSEMKIDLKINPVIILGGGSILIKQYLSKMNIIVAAEYVDNLCANAVGYKILAERQTKREEAQNNVPKR